ncbi:MAG: hypothetical protein AAGL24_28785 [Pseudomonadota bacterium]
MPENVSSEVVDWHRSVAVESDKAAWTLVERGDLSNNERMQLLTFASVARFHWSAVGDPSTRAHAEMLFSLALSRVGDGTHALEAARSAYEYFDENAADDWERAFAHAALAHAYHCTQDATRHRMHHQAADRLGSGLVDGKKSFFDATFQTIPAP